MINMHYKMYIILANLINLTRNVICIFMILTFKHLFFNRISTVNWIRLLNIMTFLKWAGRNNGTLFLMDFILKISSLILLKQTLAKCPRVNVMRQRGTCIWKRECNRSFIELLCFTWKDRFFKWVIMFLYKSVLKYIWNVHRIH